MLALSVADVRDWILIVFFSAGSVLVVFWLLASYLIVRKFGGVLSRIRGNLDATKTTLNNVAATSTLVTEAVSKPVIKTASFFHGAREALAFLTKLSKRGGE